MLRAKILVLSDAAVQGQREDRSGPAVRELLEARGWTVAASEVLPDEAGEIERTLKTWTDADDCDAVFTTGGTGLSPRDVTPEATRAVLEKEVPGIAELMRSEPWLPPVTTTTGPPSGRPSARRPSALVQRRSEPRTGFPVTTARPRGIDRIGASNVSPIPDDHPATALSARPGIASPTHR